jgi:hypothetical protein
MTPSLPLARTDGLLVEEVEDELLVYDQDHDSAHRLNRTAALVWRSCDGKHDIPALVAVLSEELGDDLADEDLVRIALDNLAERGLVDGAPQRAPEETRVSRRRFIRKVGTVGVAALALPVVTSLVAPSAASAQSPCISSTCSSSSCTCTSCVCTSTLCSSSFCTACT